MERLTNHFDYCKIIDCKFYDAELRKQGKCKFFDNSIEHCHEKRMNDKLREYEDAEDQGLLVMLPDKYVYFLVDVFSKHGGMVMKKSIKDLTLFEIEQINKRKYYSTKEEAEAALAEMEG